MIEFGLGVQVERSFHIYKIDQDRFDEENFWFFLSHCFPSPLKHTL